MYISSNISMTVPQLGHGLGPSCLCGTVGSPYQAVAYSNLTPFISTVHTILSINGKPVAAGAIVKASRFELMCDNNQVPVGSEMVLMRLLASYSWNLHKHVVYRKSKIASSDGMLITSLQSSRHPVNTILLFKLQTWILYASQPLELKVGSHAPSGTSLMTSQPFDGVVRAALSSSPAATRVLDQYKDIWPYQGSIDYKVTAVLPPSHGSCSAAS